MVNLYNLFLSNKKWIGKFVTYLKTGEMDLIHGLKYFMFLVNAYTAGFADF